MTKSKELVYAIGFGILLYSLGFRRRGRRYRYVEETEKFNDDIKIYPGYQITNCNKISIINEDSSYKYAFGKGKVSKQDVGLFNNLFNGVDCFNSLVFTETTFKFVYNLIISFLAGKVFVNTITIDDAVMFVNKNKLNVLTDPKTDILQTMQTLAEYK